jgi:hypothetical protein
VKREVRFKLLFPAQLLLTVLAFSGRNIFFQIYIITSFRGASCGGDDRAQLLPQNVIIFLNFGVQTGFLMLYS